MLVSSQSVRVLAAFAAWMALAGATPAAEAARESREDLERQVQELRRKIEDLEREVERLKAAGAGSAAPDLRELERRIEALSRDLERMRLGEAAESRADKSEHGLGPAASKIYRVKRGLSVGGYGEMLYQRFDDEKDDRTPSGKTDTADFQRAVLYLGYKFSDHILFNSETEFEHATTGEGDEEKGEVSVEFAYLDFLIHKTFNVRTGLLLVPMGFINELHEPPVFHGARRPEVETQIIPSTWRENGVGIFGEFGPWSYRAYVMASLDGTRLGSMNILDARQGGSESNAEDLAVTARLDLSGVPGLVAGASAFTGKTGLNNFEGGRLTLADVHADWKWKGLELRGLAVRGIVSDVETIDAAHVDENGAPDPLSGSGTVGERLYGYYGQIAYDVLSPLKTTEQQLFPFVRYERLDSQHRVPPGFSADPANDRTIWTGGMTYKPIPNVAIKVDYQNFRNDANTGIDQLNVAVGYLF